jgi:hypothetical protein
MWDSRENEGRIVSDSIWRNSRAIGGRRQRSGSSKKSEKVCDGFCRRWFFLAPETWGLPLRVYNPPVLCACFVPRDSVLHRLFCIIVGAGLY